MITLTVMLAFAFVKIIVFKSRPGIPPNLTQRTALKSQLFFQEGGCLATAMATAVYGTARQVLASPALWHRCTSGSSPGRAQRVNANVCLWTSLLEKKLTFLGKGEGFTISNVWGIPGRDLKTIRWQEPSLLYLNVPHRN